MDSKREQTYNILFARMIDSMTDLNDFDREEFIWLLYEICRFFDLSKGVTEFYDSLSAEKDGRGEIMIDYDDGRGEGKIAIFRRTVTPSKTVIKSTLYKSADSENLTDEEYRRLDLMLKAMLSFISRNRLQSVVEKLAFYDEFGYPNINYFSRELEMMNEKGELHGHTVIQFNLRHFALINKEVGRATGDIIIRNYLDAIKERMGGTGLICRVGGDNFAAVMKNECLENVLRILAGFPVSYTPDGDKSIFISASVGIFTIPDDYVFERPGDILNKVYIAAQDARYEFKGPVIYYNESIIFEKERQSNVRRYFADALKNNEFKSFYQPKVDILTGKIVGAEALCRWMIGEKTVLPSDFIPILEQNTDICTLDFYMLDRVCKDIRRWLDQGKNIVRVSVNLSRKHLFDFDPTEHLLKIIDENRVPHRYIEFELTETMTDVKFGDLKRITSTLRDKDISVAVDDFGIGYSSLNLIREIPWDVLKIDRAFVPTEENYGITELMFRYVVAMAQAMGLECIAEGVETEKQLEILMDNNCRIAQGFFFDKPLSVDEFEAKLNGFTYKVPGFIAM